MKNLLSPLSNSAALIGIAICLVSGMDRIAGNYSLAGFDLMTLFNGGTALMVFAALVKLHLISMQLK